MKKSSMGKQNWRFRLKAAGSIIFWGYLGALFLLPLLWRVIGESQWYLVLLRFAPPLAYLIMLILVSVFAGFCRAKFLWQGVSAGFLLVIFHYMGFCFP
ncbi:MAG: hypothetical protein HYU64_08135 [Armatimonadetes bacterium]|nr:hypothetical protein [Armatimonadota bacterium]